MSAKPSSKSESSPAARGASSSTAASTGAVYLIQDAARIAGVSPTTVRVWEQNGLVSSHRGSNGYRYFNEDDLQRLRRIAHLRKVDRLNIEGIRRELAQDGQNSSKPKPAAGEVALGPRLRKLRTDAGFTLEQAAERAELSTSFLSALERDQTGVSAKTLHRLVHIYGTTVSKILRRETNDLVQLSSERTRSRTTMPGWYVESLIGGKTLLEAELIVMEPGADSDAYTHDGEEILFILEGELDVRLGTGQRFKVRPGESLFYPSTIEHEWHNEGRTAVRFLWVATPPTF